MEWLFILGALWIVSSYLYHTSTFEPDITGIEEQLQYELDVLLGKIEPKSTIKPSQPTPKRVVYPSTHLSFVADRTPTFIFQTLYPNQFMSAEQKQEYLHSPEWQQLRALVFTRDKHTCQLCGSQSALNAHHITYEHFGAESLDQLTTLCTTCHTALHKRLGYDRTTIYKIYV